MVKVFTTDENGKIILTKEELEQMLQEAYEEGRKTSIVYYQQPPEYIYYWRYNTPEITCSTNIDKPPFIRG